LSDDVETDKAFDIVDFGWAANYGFQDRWSTALLLLNLFEMLGKVHYHFRIPD